MVLGLNSAWAKLEYNRGWLNVDFYSYQFTFGYCVRTTIGFVEIKISCIKPKTNLYCYGQKRAR